MTTGPFSLLVGTNGAQPSLAAVDYGVWLAGLLAAPVDLLGVVEVSTRRATIEQALETAGMQLKSAGIPYTVEVQTGQARQALCERARTGSHLVVFGPLGRPLGRRVLRGRSFRRITEQLASPSLYVPRHHPQLNEILVCMGGLGYATSAELWAIYLAQHSGARLTIFHVVEPIYYEYPPAREVQAHWEEILETDTPQGHFLSEALTRAAQAGVEAGFQVRRGDVVHEIIAEVQTGAYDLVVMGSPGSSTSLRHRFMPNVTAEVAENIHRPVLTARSGQEPGA